MVTNSTASVWRWMPISAMAATIVDTPHAMPATIVASSLKSKCALSIAA